SEKESLKQKEDKTKTDAKKDVTKTPPSPEPKKTAPEEKKNPELKQLTAEIANFKIL
ncbi:3956_t:CDS:1, partial [Gigaspora rosea]